MTHRRHQGNPQDPFGTRNDLERYFAANTGRRIVKWKHYFEIYDRHFARFRNTDVHLLEIGVSHGGSLRMWKDYFGPRARIWGVDINPHCRALAEPQIEIVIGSQDDRNFLRSLRASVPRIDILIDDGGHTMTQQVTTFEELFAHVTHDGVYLCEDLHTSYWADVYGGGHRRRGTFVEFSKRLIDELHAWHSREPRRFKISDLTRSIHSLHYYDSVLVIEKRAMSAPEVLETGDLTVPDFELPRNLRQKIRSWWNWKKHIWRVGVDD